MYRERKRWRNEICPVVRNQEGGHIPERFGEREKILFQGVLLLSSVMSFPFSLYVHGLLLLLLLLRLPCPLPPKKKVVAWNTRLLDRKCWTGSPPQARHLFLLLASTTPPFFLTWGSQTFSYVYIYFFFLTFRVLFSNRPQIPYSTYISPLL